MSRGDLIRGGCNLDAIQRPGNAGNGDAEKNARNCNNKHQFREGKPVSHGQK